MLRTFMIGKIHGAVVTRADPGYSGSLTLDRNLMRRAGLLSLERVQVLNLSTGARVETYLIPGKSGSGVVGVNGAAALLFKPGHRVLVIGYALMDLAEAKKVGARVLIMDGGPGNRVKSLKIQRVAR